LKKLRIIFFSGKGGVGKTTIAAATALRTAEQGYRTIIISTDPAHSLSDTFEQRPSSGIQKISKNLDAIEIDPYSELDSNWGHIRDYISSLMVALGADAIIAGELATIPGMDNLFSLLRIKEFHDSGKYDVLIVDMAPTGDSLRLLSLPQIVSVALKITRYLEKYIVSPVIRPASRVSKSLRAVVAPEKVAKSWESVLEKLLDMRKLFESNAITSTRLILNPEKMVINESQRALTYLYLFGMLTDQIIVNRVMPKDTVNSYFRDWYQIQQKHLVTIHDTFAPLPIVEVPFFKDEVVGISNLNHLGKMLYGDEDPSKLFYTEKPVKIISRKKENIFAVQIPFADQHKIELSSRGNELLLQLGSQIRSYIIPDSLSGLHPSGAEYHDGWLEIKFEKAREA
jgi:arsenite-transporting ATPase